MKKILIIFLLIYSTSLYSQFPPESDPHRGMYIDKFVKTLVNNSSVFDPEFSILSVDANHDGVFEKEDQILRYASENHISYIAMFDLHRIFGRHFMAWDENLRRNVDLEEHLCRFMKKAKMHYGITQIGAIGGSVNFFDSLSTFLNRYPMADFDVVNIEYEFWMDCPNEFPNFINILDAMYSMKENYNQAHPSNPIISEAYLAGIQYCNSSFGSQPVVETIDGCTACSPCSGCMNPHPRMADRVLHAWFISDPGSMNIAEQNLFELASTEDSTDFHPILYAESYSTGGTVNWTGIWFPLAPENNIFTAEESYYTKWRNNSSVAFGTSRQNNVQPGGTHWFTASNMAGHLDRPQILQNTGPYCETNPTTLATFNYYGPIESNIVFQFWITNNSDSSIVYPVAGGRINGVSGVYQALTSTTSLKKNIDFSDTLIFPKCYLTVGEYTAHLKLKYNGGQGSIYQCDNHVIINSQPRLEINGPSILCEGDYTYLRVNNTGGSITWYRNGIQVPSSNANLLVTEDGDYSCTISGGSGCSGTSDTVHVHILSNPAIGVNAVCNGNGTVTIKTNLLAANSASTATSGPGGVQYRWNTGDSIDQITLTPPSTNTTYRVNVTNPYTGCMRTGQITLKSPLQAPYASSIIINNQPSSPCSSDGSLTATMFASGSPNNFLWSNGATTSTITNVSPGTYSVAMNVWSSGCTSYSSITIGIPPSNDPNVQTVIQSASCTGNSDGSIQLIVTGGNPPLTYFWEFFPDDSVHQPYAMDQSMLFEGNYNVRITDASGCNFNHTINVPHANNSPVIQSVSAVAVTGCSTASNGSATVVVAGGNPPYTYLWDDSLNQTTPTALSLPSGSIQVTVTDLNGCKEKGYVNISSDEFPLQLELHDSSITEVSCVGAQDGALVLNISGGNEPYTVPSPWIVDSNFAISDSLPPGFYQIQVTDAGGCALSDSFYISNPEVMQLYSNQSPTSCIGCQDGSFDISFTGGAPPYQVTWVPTHGILTGNRIQNLPGGIYSICIEDDNDCMKCVEDTITESSPGIFELDINNLLNVFPNPYSTFTTITLMNERIISGKLLIFNFDGQIVLSHEIKNIPIILLQDDLKSGVYLLRLLDDKNVMIGGVKKLVVIN